MRAKVVSGHKRNVSPKDKRTADNIVFASRAEMKHYLDLKALQRGKVIRKLQCQPTFRFEHNGVEIGSHKPDFSFIDNADDSLHVQDKKAWVDDPKNPGKQMPIVDNDYLLRWNLMKAFFNIEVELV